MADVGKHKVAVATGPFRPEKIHSIQLLRAAAALLVALFHAQLAFSKRLTAPAFDGESYAFAFGAVGVHIFFVISGFIMVYTSRFERGFEAAAFFRRRVMRIYPIYWICAVLYLAALWLIGTPYSLSSAELAGALLLFPKDAGAIIGPAWTLSFEMFFYLCFGLAMIAGLTRGLLLLSATFCTLIIMGVLVRQDGSAWALMTNSLLIEFLAGAAIGWLLVSGKLPSRGGVSLITMSCALFAGGFAFGYDRFPSAIMWGVPSALLIAGALIVERARTPGQMVRRLGHFGDSSYALYLIHILVITLALALADRFSVLDRISPALIALPIALVALLTAELLHHRIEKPLLRRLTRRRE